LGLTREAMSSEAGPSTIRKRAKQGNTRTNEDIAESSPGLKETNPLEEPRPDVESLLTLRKMRRTHDGIDLNRLNAGEPKKKKKGKEKEKEKVDQSGPRTLVKEEEDGFDEDGTRAKRMVKSNNFTGQTNALDVDKHMMAYIEQELKKRKAEAGHPADPDDIANEVKALDPRDELYQIAEKYRVEKPPAAEGNVTLSTAMLTAIPEVDLGIDHRLKNIEDTEKAKRELFDQRQNRPYDNPEDRTFAAERFYNPTRRADNSPPPQEVPIERKQPVKRGTELATDDAVAERFKKRMRR